MSRFHHTFRSLRHRDFRLFFVGQMISMTGTWMQSTAQMWLVYRLTGSPVLLGLVGFAGQAPAVALGLVGGWAADHFDRRKIVVATQAAAMAQAAALAALTLSGHVRVGHVMALAAVLGAVNAFDMPARQSFVVKLVGPEDMPNAIALNSTLVNASRMVGPAAAGILVGWTGEGMCFLANAVSYLAVIAGLLLMRPSPAAPRSAAGSWSTQVREGVRYVAGHGEMRRLLALLGAVSLGGVPFIVLLPVFSDVVFRRGAQGLGFLTGAMGVGAMLGAVALAGRRSAAGLGRTAGLAAGVMAAGLAFLSAARTFPMGMAATALAGGGMMTVFAAANTRLQSLTTEAMRGRVMSFFSMTFLGLAPVGSLLAGALAQRAGAPWAALAGGALCAAAAVLFLLRDRPTLTYHPLP